MLSEHSRILISENHGFHVLGSGAGGSIRSDSMGCKYKSVYKKYGKSWFYIAGSIGADPASMALAFS